jgi:protocatechuate 3,4-dioxygenase beta subunit
MVSRDEIVCTRARLRASELGRMLRALVLLLVTAPVWGGVLKGVVMDNSNGRVLAGAVVVLRQLEAGGASTVRQRVQRNGMFEFTGLVAGQYLLTAARAGFLPYGYGQRSWKGAARPFEIRPDGEQFLELRLLRQPAIAGQVVDENDTGIADIPVYLYRNTRPPRMAKQARTDDSGAYRIGGLEPGDYLVRAGAMRLEEDYSVVPTFHRETARVEEAVPVEVGAGEVARDVVVRPLEGRLSRLAVEVPAPLFTGPWPVRLVSEMIDRTLVSPAVFDDLPPGRYELYTEGTIAGEPMSGYLELELGGPREVKMALSHSNPLSVQLMMGNGHTAPSTEAKLLVRRKTLAGLEAPRPLDARRTTLPAGRWLVGMEPDPKLYLLSPATGEEAGWVEAASQYGRTLGVPLRVSDQPATLSGTVKDERGQPVAGVPVHAEWYSRRLQARQGVLRTAVTGTSGAFRLEGLAPGLYRLLASFDESNPGTRIFDVASRHQVTLPEGGSATAELELAEIH